MGVPPTPDLNLLMIHSIETQLSAFPNRNSEPLTDVSDLLSRSGMEIQASDTAQPSEGFRFVANRS